MYKSELKISPVCIERFAPAIEEIRKLQNENEKGKTLLIGIDGMCAAGKTTLGFYLQSIFECNLFHMDDFFLRNHQRTKERLKEVGGNVDYERFLLEVIRPVQKKQSVLYRPYSCSTGKIENEVKIPYKRLNIVEGSYSLHPYFQEVYNLKIFLEISKEEQVRRVTERNGVQMLPRFLEEWIPKENDYFEKYQISESDTIRM